MDAMSPTIWLLAALVAALFVGLLAVASWHFAGTLTSSNVPPCRTANAALINKQSRQILQQANSQPPAPVNPITSRRVRAGLVATASAAPSPEARPRHTLHQVRDRAVQAALHDVAHGGKRRPGPYTIGTAEHAEWWAAYNQVFPPRASPAGNDPLSRLQLVNATPVSVPVQAHAQRPAAEQERA